MTVGATALNPLRRGLLVGALGVVYGDIGTSPIYTFRECLKSSGHAGPEAVLGLLSLMFWAIMLVVTIKYVCFVMRADNDGEGGIIALGGIAASAEPAEGRRRWLVLIGIAGAALFYGDGMITPAISVLSAVEGLQVATPQLKSYVVPLTIIVLIGLFLIQSRGSARIGMLFGPVMSVWFVTLAIAGAWRVAQMPSVLSAVDPRYGVAFLFGYGWTSFLALGSVFLALTGAEA
ncbi:MAG: KUP/HAK/KT family potassium transporter, partial [Alphaproteobacteria bacterium]|nr:KUP/HAK/KT family potassium transporter [Alphaproteobacteria bacterium]